LQSPATPYIVGANNQPGPRELPAKKERQPVDLLAALEAERLVPDDAASVLLVGSRALGWEHARSDLDVVVVTTSPMEAVIDERHLIAPDEDVVAS